MSQCVKLDPKNREAREALAALDTEKAAAKKAYAAAFMDGVARSDEAEARERSAEGDGGERLEVSLEVEARARDVREQARREGSRPDTCMHAHT